MTEEQAKARWCPFARIVKSNDAGTVPGDQAAFNRLDGVSVTPLMPSAATCIASACMAWRTRHQWFDNAQQDPTWVSYPPYAFEPGPGQERDDGYCGLAGELR